MKQLLLYILNSFGFPVYLQGTLNPDEEYPATFITFWTNGTEDNSHYDDFAHSVDWRFSVILYSSDPAVVNEKPGEIISAMREAGFIPQGKGQDIPSDEPTHTGWAMEFAGIEIQ